MEPASRGLGFRCSSRDHCRPTPGFPLPLDRRGEMALPPPPLAHLASEIDISDSSLVLVHPFTGAQFSFPGSLVVRRFSLVVLIDVVQSGFLGWVWGATATTSRPVGPIGDDCWSPSLRIPRISLYTLGTLAEKILPTRPRPALPRISRAKKKAPRSPGRPSTRTRRPPTASPPTRHGKACLQGKSTVLSPAVSAISNSDFPSLDIPR